MEWMSSADGVVKGDDSQFVTNVHVLSARAASCEILAELHSQLSVCIVCYYDVLF